MADDPLYEEVLRTPDEWCRLRGMRVLDPDGWRHDGAPAWDAPITESEFNWRFAESTVGPALSAPLSEIERLRDALYLIATYDKNVTDDDGHEVRGRPLIHPATRAMAANALIGPDPVLADDDTRERMVERVMSGEACRGGTTALIDGHLVDGLGRIVGYQG